MHQCHLLYDCVDAHLAFVLQVSSGEEKIPDGT